MTSSDAITESKPRGKDRLARSSYPRIMLMTWGLCSLAWLSIALDHLSHLFDHFAETFDFGVFFQAATLLARGQWNPYISIWGITNYPKWGIPFIANHMELLMWPLSLVIRLFPSGFALLVIEAIFLTLTQLLVCHWISKVVWPHLTNLASRALFIGSLVLFVYGNAWWLAATSFSFHLEPISTFLLLLTAYLYYYDRRLLSFIAALLLCLSGVTQALYLVGLGLGLWLLDRRGNRSALLFPLFGVSTYVVAATLNLNAGTPFAELYGYLGGGTPVQALQAILHNPVPLLHQVRKNLGPASELLIAGGPLGIIDWLAGLVVLLIMVPEWFAGTNIFLTQLAAFQTIAIQPFLPLGSAFLYVRVRTAARSLLFRGWLVVFVATVLAACYTLPQAVRGAFAVDNYVPRTAAVQLSRVIDRISPDSEVIVPDGIAGRFAGRRYVYPIIAPSLLKFPVWASPTYIVLPKDFTGFEGVPGSYYASLAAHLEAEHRPGWHVWISNPAITVFVVESNHMGRYIDLSS